MQLALFCRAFTVAKAALNLSPAQRAPTVTRRGCLGHQRAARVAVVSTVLLQDRLGQAVPARLASIARAGL